MKHMLLLIMTTGLTSTGLAKSENLPLHSSWKCKIENAFDKQKQICNRDSEGRRSVVRGTAKRAKPNQLDVDFKVLSAEVVGTSTVEPVQRKTIDGQVWLEKKLQVNGVPVPSLALHTVKGGAAFQYFVIADEKDFDAIKNEIREAVAHSN